MPEYYSKMRDAVLTRRTISLGISCFKSVAEYVKPYPECCDPLQFACTTYNILLFPGGEFDMDGSARSFLVAHGFDLNRWAQYGIEYGMKENNERFVDELTTVLLLSKAEVVFHNGLADLAYFYHSFWNPLPKTCEIFAADVADVFQGRLFDTKWICRSVLKWRMHSLEYCFKKAQRLNAASADIGKPALRIRHVHPSTINAVMEIPIFYQNTQSGNLGGVKPIVGKDVCELMYNFGFCNAFKQGTCLHPADLHQMDLVLDVEEDVCRNGPAENAVSRPPNDVQRMFPVFPMSDPREMTTTVNDVATAGKRKTDAVTLESVPLKKASEGSLFPHALRPRLAPPRPADNFPVAQRLGTDHFSIDNRKSYNLDFGLHSAGFDAFMTGYVFATCMAQLGRSEKARRVVFTHPEGFVDRVHVTGKSEPFVFRKSEHVQCSAAHFRKILECRNRQ
ncbi:target of EGR1 protein 1-like isoform X2 [Paramacrobiotus metropolitanus]|nr:target of EGR1 protein 1-like isoform X2 [Paramacrobiotus metropolitanus]